MKKNKTNTQSLKALIASNEKLNPVLNALLRERIIKIMEMTMEDIQDNPTKWNDSFISPLLIKSLSEQVEITIGYDN